MFPEGPVKPTDTMFLSLPEGKSDIVFAFAWCELPLKFQHNLMSQNWEALTYFKIMTLFEVNWNFKNGAQLSMSSLQKEMQT